MIAAFAQLAGLDIQMGKQMDTKDQNIADIWRESLNIDITNDDNDFFELGGDSILATEMLNKVSAELGVTVGLDEFFSNASLDGLLSLTGQPSRKNEALIPSLPAGDKYVLTDGQTRIWLFQQLMPNNSAYNVTRAFRVPAAAGSAAVNNAITLLVKRHAALRTVFSSQEGVPVQIIQEEMFSSIENKYAENENTIAEILVELGSRPFNLESGPLFRCAIIETWDRRTILGLCIHHIVSDATSFELLKRELWSLLDGERGQCLQPLSIEYKDFAAWQEQYLQSAVGQRGREYWLQHLSGISPSDVSCDFPVSEHISGRGSVYAFHIPLTQTELLQTYTQNNKTTMFVVLATAMFLLLHKMTGRTELTIGAPVSIRDHHDIENIVGFFVNAVLLKVKVRAEATLDNFLREVHQTVQEALLHRHFPLEKTLDELKIRSWLGESNLSSVYLNFLPNSDRNEELFLKHARHLDLGRDIRFDMDIYVTRCADGLAFECHYKKEKFKPETIEYLFSEYCDLLQSFSNISATDIQSIGCFEKIFTPSQPSEVARNTIQQVDQVELEHSVIHCFEQQVNLTPTNTAITEFDTSISYAKLDDISRSIALCIETEIVLGGGAIALLFGHKLRMIGGMLGALRTGEPYVPLDPNYPEERLKFLVQDAHVGVILTDAENWDLAGRLSVSGEKVICVDFLRSAELNPKVAGFGKEAAAESIAYILYTSGSTGNPKGVIQNNRNVLYFIKNYIRALNLNSTDKISLLASCSFDAAVMDIYGALLSGATLLPFDPRCDSREIVQWLKDAKVTVYHSTPTVFRHCMQGMHDREQLTDVRMVILGGEPIDYSDIQLFQRYFSESCILVNGFGPTESTLALQNFVKTNQAISRYEKSCGYSIPGTNVHVVNDRGEEAGVFATGEIVIESPYVALGYWGQEELTHKVFSVAKSGTREYRTGDLGRRLPDGRIEHVGRRDQMIKFHGVRIELGEIESALKGLSEIKDAVVASGRIHNNEVLIAYIVPAYVGIDVGAIRDALALKIPQYMIPGKYILLEQIPRNPNGKTDRGALPKIRESTDVDVRREPLTAIEHELSNSWRALLGIDELSIDHDFFALGGNSLMAARLVAKVRDKYGITLNLRDIFEARTIQKLGSRVEYLLDHSTLDRTLIIQNASEGCTIPLAAGQRGLWFIEKAQSSKEGTSYNIGVAAHIRDDLKITVLKKSLQLIIQRHSILRTQFVDSQGEPEQIVISDIDPNISFFDLSHLDARIALNTGRQLLEEDIIRPFDLSVAPLFRVVVFKLSSTESLVGFVFHHLIADAWSLRAFGVELVTAYASFEKDSLPKLPVLRIQYSDYSVWQGCDTTNERFVTQLKYWKQKLSGLEGRLDISSKERQEIGVNNGESLSFVISRHLTSDLARLQDESGTTSFMMLCAAYHILLAQYSGKTDVVVGTPVANRASSELEPLIGLFINTVVLRADVNYELTFLEFLASFKETVLDALSNKDVPFERVVAEVRPERSANLSPLFQVMFVLQNTPTADYKVPGVQMRLSSIKRRASKFDITLSASERNGRVVFWFEYNADILDRCVVSKMAAQYKAILKRIVQQPTASLKEIQEIHLEERKSIVKALTGVTREYPNKTLKDLFESQVLSTPLSVALKFGDAELTYSQLDATANRLCRDLIQRGIGRGSMVPIVIKEGFDVPIGMLGVLKAGAAFVPIDLAWPVSRIEAILDDLNPQCVVVGSEFPYGDVDGLDEWEKVVVPDPGTSGLVLAGTSNHCLPLDPIYAIYTSGSTGMPKAAVNTNRGIANRLFWMNDYFGCDAAQVTLQTTRHVFDSAVWQIFWPLINGGSVVLLPHSRLPDIDGIVSIVQKHKVTTIDFVPSLLNALVERCIDDESIETRFGSIKHLIVGGEEAKPGDVNFVMGNFSWIAVTNLYGPTETSIGCIAYRVTSEATTRIPIGKPIANVFALIVNKLGEMVPLGVPGELLLGGHCVGLGYLNDDVKTLKAFIENRWIPNDTSGCLYRTGDLVRCMPDGNIEYLGRIDRQVKIRGFRVELGEIEAAFRRSDKIGDIAVCRAKALGGREDVTVAHVVLRQDGSVDGLRRFIGDQLPNYMHPTHYIEYDRLPINQAGKVDYSLLKTKIPSPTKPLHPVQGLTIFERKIKSVVEDLLGAENVDIHGNFFDIGLHSLSALRLHEKLEKEFELTFPVLSLFTYPTVVALAGQLSRSEQ